MHPLSNIRSCATGKRCLSAFYGTRNPETTERCSECGYYHEINAAKKPAENKPEFTVKTIKAIEVRPLDCIEIIGVEGSEYHTVTGFNHCDGTVEFIFTERKPLFVAVNTPVKVLLENKEDASLSSRRNDSQLAEAVEATARTSNAEKKMGDDFGYAAFDWIESAIRMMRAGEWAEIHPENSMLRDLETLIGDNVIAGNSYHEIQPKFRAAVRTLESLGYSYPVEGAEQWRPAAGDVPDFIQWEKAMDPGIIPPVQSQVVVISKRMPVVYIAGVLGAGLDMLLLSVQEDETKEPEEMAINIDEHIILPYNQERVMRAEDYARDMREDVRLKITPQLFKNGLMIAYRDVLDKVE